MNRRRPAPIVAGAIMLAAVIAWGCVRARPAPCSQTEVIRGTVDRFRPGILVLTNVKFEDGTDAGRTVMVIVNKDTGYFDGPMRTTKESITPGVKVLVKCEPAGTGRVAVLVRIVGR